MATISRSTRPLTADEVAKLARQPTSSVYRNLAVLTDVDALAVMTGSDRSERYALADELRGFHRHHLICLECGGVEEYAPPVELEGVVGRIMPLIAAKRGFDLRSHTLDLLGICNVCTVRNRLVSR